MFRNKRLNMQQRKAKLLKLLTLQIFLFYYVITATMYYFSSTNAYFGDITYASVEIKNNDKFPNKPPNGNIDSSSLEPVRSWIQCPKVFASFYNNGGDMSVDTTYSVYRQIQGHNWELLETFPLVALKSKETRILSYEPKESGTYRFVVEQVPTHPGNSHPKIETPEFNFGKCTTNKSSGEQSNAGKNQTEDVTTQQEESTSTLNQTEAATNQQESTLTENANKPNESNTEEVEKENETTSTDEAVTGGN